MNFSSVSRILGFWESNRTLWESILGVCEYIFASGSRFWARKVDGVDFLPMIVDFGPLIRVNFRAMEVDF